MELITNKNTDLSTTEITKVLIVDNNAAMRESLNAALTQWGYQVIEAKDGLEAWEKMQLPDAPRLLILDWLMPKLDGITLCERIRKKLSYYPYIIFLTQVSGTTNIIRGIEAGADEFLLKPVNFHELRSRVFIGERVIEYQKIIAGQKQQLQSFISSVQTLQALLIILLKEKFN